MNVDEGDSGGRDGVAPRDRGLIALERFESKTTALAQSFRDVRPFPHVVLENFLELDSSSRAEFPTLEWPHWERLTDGYQEGKSTCRELEVIPRPWRTIIEELSAPRFMRFLEAVTGISKLLPDPYLEGGGLHLSGPGGHLAPHTDFHVYERLDLYRRVNLLLYLNENWQPENGGNLALFDANDLSHPVEVAPEWGTCVIFATDDGSVHGVNPVADGCLRHSIALYYYTSAETPGYSGDTSTHWKTHDDGRGVRRVQLWAYFAFMKMSRLFSMLAHLVNPQFGLRMVKERLARRRADRP
jgi:Rps23 Pro-64 3,4-dihydroxylase Tpa1-like proline 4-hydroxylase